MRRLLVVVLALCFAGVAMAATTGTTFDKAANWINNSDNGSDGREGGETIQTAVVIPSLPYNDTGATCDNVNNYDEICPYSGSTSADVVYAYTPSQNVAITADLCNSSYDTKIYIYAGAQGNLVACNDDAGCGYSGWQSKVENIPLSAGVNYYIVIDGYGGACGTYVLHMQAYAPCVVTCPGGAQQEGEPPCTPNYYDNTNGGCNSTPNVFEPMGSSAGGCGDMCGKSGTYTYSGLSYRDTDWFLVTSASGNITADCTAEFPLQFIFIYVTDCNNIQYNLLTGGPCQTLSLSYPTPTGSIAWLWVGPQVFSGLGACDGSPGTNYVLHACGITPIFTPVEKATWGGIKSLYR